MAHQQADLDPRVVNARDPRDEARREKQRLATRQAHERADLRRQVAGDQPASSAPAQAARWRARAEAARRDLTAIEALPIAEAAQLIRDRADRTAAARVADEAATPARPVPSAARQPSTERDFGPSL